MFSYLCFCLQDLIKIIKSLLATVSIDGLIHSSQQQPKILWHLWDILSLLKHILEKLFEQEL